MSTRKTPDFYLDFPAGKTVLSLYNRAVLSCAVLYHDYMKQGISKMYGFFDFNYENAIFEWDDEKAASNFKKHGTRFETASKVFTDENKRI